MYLCAWTQHSVTGLWSWFSLPTFMEVFRVWSYTAKLIDLLPEPPMAPDPGPQTPPHHHHQSLATVTITVSVSNNCQDNFVSICNNMTTYICTGVDYPLYTHKVYKFPASPTPRTMFYTVTISRKHSFVMTLKKKSTKLSLLLKRAKARTTMLNQS